MILTINKENQNLYLHYGTDIFRPELFKSIKNRENFNKPANGFWGTPINGGYTWRDYCQDELPYLCYLLNKVCLFRLKPGAKMIRIEKKEDVEEIKHYQKEGIYSTSYPLDYEQLAKEYDAIEWWKNDFTHWQFYGWDIDSIVVLNASAIEPIIGTERKQLIEKFGLKLESN